MATETTTASRRALLAGLVALPALGVAGQAIATTTDRAAWDRAMLEWARLKRIADGVVSVHDRAWEAAQAEAPEPDRSIFLQTSVREALARRKPLRRGGPAQFAS